jgi:16S rRNA (guanine(966)-N(2))-methyltransferase RsmD
MRIIAGAHRGRKLEPPPGDNTRPITDRAKQSLFDVLAPRILGSRIADLFCGTGSMGLECLSRGSGDVVFFEADRGALAALKRNIAAMKVDGSSHVVAGDLFRLAPATLGPAGTDLMFLDPPYAYLHEHPDALRQLAVRLAPSLAPGGWLIFRHDTADQLDLPPFQVDRTLTYGSMAIELLSVPTAAS